MAKKNQNPKPGDVADAFRQPAEGEEVKFKSYRNDGKGFDEFNEGDEIVGILVSIRDHPITDQRSGDPKDIRVYSIRISDGTVLKIGGRTILDRMFDDIMDENGGYMVDNRRYSGKGYEYLQNRAIKMVRGDDTRTRNKNPLGTYEVMVEE